MTTKEELINYIREWINIDNTIKDHQLEMKKLRLKKKDLTNQLVDIMKTNEIDCFDIKNGKLLYATSKVKAPISKKYLQECLRTYFEDIPNINGVDVAEHILESREIKVRENIRRKTNK